MLCLFMVELFTAQYQSLSLSSYVVFTFFLKKSMYNQKKYLMLLYPIS